MNEHLDIADIILSKLVVPHYTAITNLKPIDHQLEVERCETEMRRIDKEAREIEYHEKQIRNKRKHARKSCKKRWKQNKRIRMQNALQDTLLHT